MGQHGSTIGLIGVVVATLTAILVCASIFYNIENTSELPQIETQYTGITNTSDVVKTLAYEPKSGEFSGTWYNATEGIATHWTALTAGEFTRSGKTLTLLSFTHPLLNMTKVNVSYYTEAGVYTRDVMNPQANTVFQLAPLIAIILIAGIILLIAVGFGKNSI